MKTKFSIMFTGMHPMDKFVPWAQRMEKHGFDEILIADDLIFRPAWPILTMIGENTSTIKVGPAIVNPITAHPVYHATSLMALDEITGGRAVCAMGKGAFNANLRIDNPEKPIRMIKEAYYIMKHVIAGKTEAFEGDYFKTAEGFKLEFEALRSDIPILIGTWGPQMAKMAGRHSAGLIAACCSGETMQRLINQTLAGAEDAGRDPSSIEIVSAPLSSISMDPAAARRNVTDLLGVLMPTMPILTRPLDISDAEVKTIHNHAMAGDLDKVAELIPDRAVKAFALAGTPDQIIPEVEEMISMGVNHINFTPPLGPNVEEAIDLIASQILPHFKN